MNKDKRITIRFTEKEWDGICHRAELEDMPLSQYIRLMIDRGERAQTEKQDLSW